MRTIVALTIMVIGTLMMNAKTLVAYYSYTNNVERVVSELKSQIECDVLEIEPSL